ncbi:hypothetical protein COU60_04915 [Candidatus Pacearchaeota archaeon CG10_big_fil_rev_8_21_14_0_10_34_76]|nr:MAG: hypothetical protein COU60_04915 [Candidatus Pacearchaeota archaeon CG10_big_fil_rev_8_21_14_0_10_34_76]
MADTKKLIVALLILAIIFSAASIAISIGASNIKIPQKSVSGNSVVEDIGGGISLTVKGEVEGLNNG